jgi:hypothetical protein
VTSGSGLTVSGFRFHSGTVGCDQFRGHHTETAESLSENVALCKQILDSRQLSIARLAEEK